MWWGGARSGSYGGNKLAVCRALCMAGLKKCTLDVCMFAVSFNMCMSARSGWDAMLGCPIGVTPERVLGRISPLSAYLSSVHACPQVWDRTSRRRPVDLKAMYPEQYGHWTKKKREPRCSEYQAVCMLVLIGVLGPRSCGWAWQACCV